MSVSKTAILIQGQIIKLLDYESRVAPQVLLLWRNSKLKVQSTLQSTYFFNTVNSSKASHPTQWFIFRQNARMSKERVMEQIHIAKDVNVIGCCKLRPYLWLVYQQHTITPPRHVHRALEVTKAFWQDFLN